MIWYAMKSFSCLSSRILVYLFRVFSILCFSFLYSLLFCSIPCYPIVFSSAFLNNPIKENDVSLYFLLFSSIFKRHDMFHMIFYGITSYVVIGNYIRFFTLIDTVGCSMILSSTFSNVLFLLFLYCIPLYSWCFSFHITFLKNCLTSIWFD